MVNILWFKDIKKEDVAYVGGKGANLGEMYNIPLPIPPGFVVTAQAYKKFLDYTGIKEQIMHILNNTNVDENEELQIASKKIKEIIINAKMPSDIENDISESYDNLNVNNDIISQLNKNALSMIKVGRDLPYVAVRSSATAEDLPQYSFAGQNETFLNVKGADKVINAVQHCWASLFTARSIYYRVKNNFQHEKVLIAVIVQRMVNPDLTGASGVMFSVNPATNNKDEIMIEAAFGLGEVVVGGQITPDTYIIDKETLKIKSKKIAIQPYALLRGYKDGNRKEILPKEKGSQQKINDEIIIKLAEYGKKIEEHYGSAQDIEWAIEKNKVYIVQSRAVTTLLKKREESEKIITEAKPIFEGLGASPGIATGKVKIVNDLPDLSKIERGDVLVTQMTSPDMVSAMKRAIAIITDEGGLTCHAAIVSREMGIPAIVGTEKATKILKENQLITVDATSGKIYEGSVALEKKEIKEEIIKEKIETKTKVYMNLGEPEKIADYKNLQFDGIGLMRIEFIISSYIGKHPLFLIENNQQDIYIDKLAEGISKVASEINPKPVIVRFSDFKSNEYKGLEGGDKFEPHEDNPLIGWRGVSRYVSSDFIEAFKLECMAIKKVRSTLKNVHVMLPFVRTIDEVKKCMEIMKNEGLERDEDFEIWLMAEVPSMALIPEDFAQLDIDGVSIGSNDLTMLVLGVDRDSAKLGKMGYFDERNKAVLTAIKNIIDGFHKYNKTVSICGQSVSVYHKVLKFVLKHGIDSVSINPDTVNKIRRYVAEIEDLLKE